MDQNEQEALDFLAKRKAEKQAALTAQATAQVAPLTTQALQQQAAPVAQPAPTNQIQFSSAAGVQTRPTESDFDFTKRYVEQNQAKDANGNPIEFDYKNGIPLGIYMRVAVQRDPKDKVEVLKKFYGDNFVRLDTGDQPIVRITDQTTGQPKDVLVNPLGVDFKDMTDIIGQAAIPVASAALQARYGRALPVTGTPLQRLGNWAMEALKSGVAAESGGAVQDVTARLSEGLDIRPGEIAKSRAEMVGLDVLGAAAGTAAGTAAGFVRAPFARNMSAENVNRLKAMDRINDLITSGGGNVNVEATPAMLSGSSMLQRFESFTSAMPGGSGVFQSLRNQNEEAFKQAENIILGLAPETEIAARVLPTAEQVGTDVASTLEKQAVLPAQQALKGAEKAAKTQVQGNLVKSALSGSLPPVGGKTATGDMLRAAVVAGRNAEKAPLAARYEEIMSNPKVQPFNIEGTGLQKKVNQLKKDLPRVEETITSESGLLDEAGRPIMVDSRGTRVQKPYIPEGIASKFNEITAAKEPSYRLNDLIKMRTEVENAIAQGEAVPGVDTHFLGKLKSFLTAEIRNGLDSIDPALRAKWESVNTDYAKFAQKYENRSVKRMFLDESQSGYMGGESIVDYYTKGSQGAQHFRALMKTLGPESAEFKALKGQIVSDTLENSRGVFTGSIDPERLMGQLKTLRETAPETFDEVFGKNASDMMDFAATLGALEKIPSIPEDMARELLTSPKKPSMALFNLARKQEEANKLFNNKIIKQVRNNTLNPGSLDPQELVQALRTTPVRQIEEVMSYVGRDPAVMERVQQLALQDVLFKATNAEGGTTATMIGGKTRQSILNAIGDADQKKKLEAIIGKSKLDDVLAMADFMGGGMDKAFRTAGGLASGMMISQLLKGHLLTYGQRYALSWLEGKLLLSDWLRNYALRKPISNDTANAMFSAWLIATPGVREALADIANGSAVEGARLIKMSLDQRFPVSESNRNQMTPEEALKFLEQRKSQK